MVLEHLPPPAHRIKAAPAAPLPRETRSVPGELSSGLWDQKPPAAQVWLSARTLGMVLAMPYH